MVAKPMTTVASALKFVAALALFVALLDGMPVLCLVIQVQR